MKNLQWTMWTALNHHNITCTQVYPYPYFPQLTQLSNTITTVINSQGSYYNCSLNLNCVIFSCHATCRSFACSVMIGSLSGIVRADVSLQNCWFLSKRKRNYSLSLSLFLSGFTEEDRCVISSHWAFFSLIICYWQNSETSASFSARLHGRHRELWAKC